MISVREKLPCNFFRITKDLSMLEKLFYSYQYPQSIIFVPISLTYPIKILYEDNCFEITVRKIKFLLNASNPA